jgi:excinuclease UvrABC nuclease subunit
MIDLSDLPAISAIYRVRYRDRIIYIGQTVNLKKRWQSHHILPKLLLQYGTDWTIDWVEISPSNLNRAEAFAYRQFKPELNLKDPSTLLGLDS